MPGQSPWVSHWAQECEHSSCFRIEDICKYFLTYTRQGHVLTECEWPSEERKCSIILTRTLLVFRARIPGSEGRGLLKRYCAAKSSCISDNEEKYETCSDWFWWPIGVRHAYWYSIYKCSQSCYLIMCSSIPLGLPAPAVGCFSGCFCTRSSLPYFVQSRLECDLEDKSTISTH